jgi:cell division protein FtsW
MLVLIVATLLALGCIAVYSSTAIIAHEATGRTWTFLTHHLLGIALGLFCGAACLAIPYDVLRRSGKFMVAVSLVLLVLVELLGSEVGGAKRWFHIGRLSVQPSEFAQLALVVYLADVLARKRAVIRSLRDGVLPPLMVTGAVAGLVLIQPDLGTATVMMSVCLLLLLIAKARGSHLLGTMGLGVVALAVLIAGAEYRRRRMLAFLHPWEDPQGIGFQIIQSYVALADGGLIGRGLGESLQRLFFLPGAHTDFIFAMIGEELGWLGTTAILALFGLLATCGIRMAQLTEDIFGKFLISGCIALLSLEAIVHMAVVTGMIPTKGLPLPLVSYGGSSMVINVMACSLIIWASFRHPPSEMDGLRPS